MKRNRPQYVFLLASALLIPAAVSAQQITITATKMEEKTDFRGKKNCKISFSVTNNAYGTIDRLTAHLTAFDDRGREVDELLSATAGNQNRFSRKPVAKGSTVTGVGDATFKEECQYISAIRIDKIKPEDCGMRLLPENVSCSKFTTLKSDLPNLKVLDPSS